MDSINKKIVIATIVLSLITTGFIFSYINSLSKTASTNDLIRIYVAAKTLPDRTKISITDIKPVEVEKRYVESNAITRKDDILGKRVKETIYEGEQIRKDRVANERQMNLAYSIPDGMRAISININEAIGVSYKIEQGDYVDVAATFQSEERALASGKIVYPKITKIILQKILVLAVGEGSNKDNKETKSSNPKTVTLAVDIKDAEKLIYSSEGASLKLMLRPVDDDKTINTDGSIRPEITGSKGSVTLQK